MLVSDNMKRPITRGSWVMVVILGLFVLPLGMVSGQNFEKVEKKLARSVEKGHLSEQQAEAMLKTLHRMSESEAADSASKRKAWMIEEKKSGRLAELRKIAEMQMMEAEKQVRKAIANRKISQREGREKLSALKQSVIDSLKQNEERIQILKESDQRAIEQKEAMALQKMAAMKEQMMAAKKQVAEYEAVLEMRKAEMEMEAAVEKKKVAEYEAKRHLKESATKVQDAVAKGQLTKEEARRKMAAIEARLADAQRMLAESQAKRALEQVKLAESRGRLQLQAKDAAGKGSSASVLARRKKLAVQEEREEKRRQVSEYKKQAEAYLQNARNKIEEAAAQGELTREEAREQLEEIRDRLAQRVNRAESLTRNPSGDEGKARNGVLRLRAYGEKLRQAVEDKIISGEEAKQKYEAANQRMNGGASGSDARSSKAAKEPSSNDEKMRAIGMEIRRAISNGEMTREEGRAKMEAIRKKMDGANKEKDGGR